MKHTLSFIGALCAVMLTLPTTLEASSGPLKQWTVASEVPDYQVKVLPARSHPADVLLADTLEIVSPKGLTLWYNQKMQGDVVIEYDACLMVEEGHPEDRLSDLNCFWMASRPDLDRRTSQPLYGDPRQIPGRFLDSYRMQLYYVGFGGNSNKTTRFRRYTGDERGVDSVQYRPAILTEYTDAAHLNVANRWRHIRLTSSTDGHVTYEIDGEKLVDYLDPQPLTEGWFGVRTTWSRLRITNFRYSQSVSSPAFPIELHDVSHVTAQGQMMLRRVVTPYDVRPVNFGVPFAEGEVHAGDSFVLDEAPVDFRPLAYWPDGSVKWGGFAGTASPRSVYLLDRVQPVKRSRKSPQHSPVSAQEAWTQMLQQLGLSDLYCQYQEEGGEPVRILFDCISVEQSSPLQTVLLAHSPLVDLRAYITQGTREVRLVHTFVNLRPDDAPMLRSLSVVAEMPLHEQLYNRHFATHMLSEQQVWHEPVQPLTGRRQLPDSLYLRQMRGERIPDPETFDRRSQALIRDWATWDGYRVSQTNDMGYTIRKRAKSGPATPWIGTMAGQHSSGTVFVGETGHGIVATLQDFWQSYPSTLLVEGMTSDKARLEIQLWSAEAEPMDLRHYDTVAHGLEAAYEDVQQGMSTPSGIARTSEISLVPTEGWPGDLVFAALSAEQQSRRQLICSPQYLHDQRAFGIWSLPQTAAPEVEEALNYWQQFYVDEQQRRHWYGYWNYGDVMHAYDEVRGEWRYDIGGFAWDNTELASNMMLWYNFLRTGRYDLWKMAVAMTRHTSEVDVYHAGPWAGLGSRHNVTHWGCGAKESRISEAQWNRFYYYLSGGDERIGQLMRDVVDSDTLLYTLDPMRLAQPRSKFPCTAPARLRIGPDWLGYVSNWMTEWERTQDERYLRKIIAGMRSINALPNGIFTGPKALGYDPATGEISWEGDASVTNTNHLLPIMGGFEMMNELLQLPVEGMKSLSLEEKQAFRQFRETWLHLCREYQVRSENGFRIPRLQGYAAWHDRNPEMKRKAWESMKIGQPTPENFSTNGISCWCLDAIYLLEVAR